MKKHIRYIWKLCIVLFLALAVTLVCCPFHSSSIKIRFENEVSYIRYQNIMYIETEYRSWRTLIPHYYKEGNALDTFGIVYEDIGWFFSFPFYSAYYTYFGESENAPFIYNQRGYKMYFPENYDPNKVSMIACNDCYTAKSEFTFTFEQILGEAVKDLDVCNISNSDAQVFVYSYMAECPCIIRNFSIIYYEIK